MESRVELDAVIKPFRLREVDTKPIRWMVLAAVLSSNLFMVIAGVVESYSAPATVDMVKPGSRFMNVTSDQVTWIASLPVLFAGLGCLFSGYTTHVFGRRATLIFLSPPFTLAWLMIAYAPDIWWVYSGRVVCGFCFGMSCVPVPAYVTEIAPVRIRGFLSTFNHMSYTIGCFVTNLLAYGLRWSWLAVAGAVLTALAMVLMVIMPESPGWLLKNNRKQEAVQSLKFLQGKGFDIDREIDLLQKDVNAQSESTFSWRLVLDPIVYKPAVISLCLILFSKMVGINVITSYTVEIFQNTGSVLDPQTSTVLVTVVNILGTLVASCFIDRVGRRFLYITSAVFLTITLGSLGMYDYLLRKQYDMSQWEWVPLVSLFLYMGSYSLGLGPMMMVMIPEMQPIQTRSTVLSIACMWSSGFAFMMTKLFAVMVDSLGYYGLFWTFGVSSSIAILFGVFVLPETKGRTILEISNSFRSPTRKS